MDQQFLNIRILTGLQLPLKNYLEVLIDINPVSGQSKFLGVAFGRLLLGAVFEGSLMRGEILCGGGAQCIKRNRIKNF